MDDETLRQVQLTQLEMAKEIKRICEDHGIHYFLDSGSLLGAVRHKGFIPWDDDMDFGMLRCDYECFLKIAPYELDNNYFLQTWHNDSNYPFAFAKIRKRGTVYQEEALIHCDAHNELYIDIFPYDNYPDDSSLRRRQGFIIMLNRYAILTKRKTKPWLNHHNHIKRLLVRLKYLPAIIYSFFHSTDEMIARIEKEMVRFNDLNTQKLFPQGSSIYGKWTISVDCFNDYVQLPFDDTTFSAPSGYVKYLTEAYGDYLKLPPEHKRKNHHHIIELKL